MDDDEAALLAELRAISNKSTASRFDNGEEGSTSQPPREPLAPLESHPAPVSPIASRAKAARQSTPPWKKNRLKAFNKGRLDSQATDEVAGVVVVAPLPPTETKAVVDLPSTETISAMEDISCNTMLHRPAIQTFKGERGGPAEDGELLALLKSVSNQSASASRFADNDEQGTLPSLNVLSVQEERKPPPKPVKTAGPSDALPPWKRHQSIASRSKQAEVEVDIAAPPLPREKPPRPRSPDPEVREPKFGDKPDLPSTFNGDRGGSAEDAELLALLRGVSAKSSGANRFDEDSAPPPGVPLTKPSEPETVLPGSKEERDNGIPPWKRRSSKKAESSSVDVQVDFLSDSEKAQKPNVDDPPIGPVPPEPKHGIKSNMPSTFKGERGGTAEDAELLALLRGVSAKSAGTDRFADFDTLEPRSSQSTFQGDRSGSLEGAESSARLRGLEGNNRSATDRDVQNGGAPIGDDNPTTATRSVPTSSPTPVLEDQNDDVMVTQSQLPDALTDKNWKVRGKAYELLGTLLEQRVGGRQGVWDLDSDNILPGLDDLLPKMLAESNASALDKALVFALLYSEHCTAAGSSDQARRLVSVLLTKIGFSSRPTTTKFASALTMKLMEVGTSGPSSIHAVVECLIDVGLKSRKPKVVSSSASLILDATLEFGAANLPLVAVSKALPAMLSHSNASVRSTGLQVLSEICRMLGSKTAMHDVVEGLKPSMLSELDALLAKDPPQVVQRKIRSQSNGMDAKGRGDALAQPQFDVKDFEAQRFAARPSVDVVQALASTDYSSRLQMAKWSDKVAALTLVIECGGEKPYKLVQPTDSTKYAPVISDMKRLLGHTHVAVVGKSLEVLSMLAEGVGERLYPNLRPLLPDLLRLSKDKKLTRSVGSCLDSLFGNVLSFDHLLDRDDALPTSLEESKEKNAIVRATALESLRRCVERGDSAGPRGALTSKMAGGVANLCVEKLGDSDASVRKAAIDTLRALQACENGEIRLVWSQTLDLIKESNSRVYKDLAKSETGRFIASGHANEAVKTAVGTRAITTSTNPQSSSAQRRPGKDDVEKNDQHVIRERHGKVTATDMPIDLEDALARVEGLNIRQWDAPEDDGGISQGLRSSKWMLRQDAIKSITAFIESGGMSSSVDMADDLTALLVIVGERTRGFQETNVNIMKAILQLFQSICDCHEAAEKPVAAWTMRNATNVAVSKISDRKLSSACYALLLSLCVVAVPHAVLKHGFESIEPIKAPVVHEEFLKWIWKFSVEFGAGALGRDIADLIPCVLEELGGSNAKVKDAALKVLGEFHRQIGPPIKVLSLSLAKPALRQVLEKCFAEAAFDPALDKADFPRRSLPLSLSLLSSAPDQGSADISLQVPRCDLFDTVNDDCIAQLSSKDGKASWKARKQALEDIEAALNRCAGLLDVSGPRQNKILEFSRALRDRLNDTQINLKPLAARVIGSLLAVVGQPVQSKIGRVVFGTLINCAMNDIKKPMRDACLDALQKGTSVSTLEGGGVDVDSSMTFLTALLSEVTESSSRAGGLPDLLSFLVVVVHFLPNLDDTNELRGPPLGDKYAAMIVECMTSSKSETRAAGTSLLEASVARGLVGPNNFRKATAKLKPAKQRSLGPTLAKLVYAATLPTETEKENDELPVPVTHSPVRMPKTNVQRTARKAELNPSHHHQPLGNPRARKQSTANPLGNQMNSSGIRSVVWPEYPEEPQGSVLFESLRRAWSPTIPSSASTVLFPDTGIRKQDDAQSGCILLSEALQMDRSSHSNVLVSQLDMVLRWTAYVLSSKETSVGLQVLTSLVSDLLLFLVDRKHQLPESESLILMPFLLEKASTSKGRFHDKFAEILNTMKEQLLSPKVLGATVCVAVIERSAHAKARTLACHVCIECVEKEGLAGIGKKGILVTAKALSEESVPESRGATLDLMELALNKMGGDFQRLVRICGPNLSEQASKLVQERVAKSEKKDHDSSGSAPTRLPTSHTEIPSTSPTTRYVSELHEELPMLSLRNIRGGLGGASDEFNDDGIDAAFSFSSSVSKQPRTLDHSGIGESVSPGNSERFGGAALLRERLQKIRQQTVLPSSVTGGGRESTIAEPASVDLDEDAYTSYTDGIRNLNALMTTDMPIAEEHGGMVDCINSLKRFHAALSKQRHPAAGMSVDAIDRLRSVINSNLSETVEYLTRLISFAFGCGEPHVNVGMSIPLLSVCLATLMALFRDPELSLAVTKDDLTLLVRETGTALLDHHLASSSGLEEATASQMVRAINKLAVQAATGAARSTAFLSLMSLQLQVAFGLEGSSEIDMTFNIRLSRVISKLFARVIKSEEAMAEPFSTDSVDLEAILCSIEDFLVGCRESATNAAAVWDEAHRTCESMIRTLIDSILQTYDSSTVLRMLDDLGINRHDSLLGSIIYERVEDAREVTSAQDNPVTRGAGDSALSLDQTAWEGPGQSAARDVASLVSAVGSVSSGAERDAALEALRHYKTVHGDEELVAHLEQVSPAFRAFIEEQLGRNDAGVGIQPGQSPTVGGTMSERLRNLRSRLEATELAVQTAVDAKPSGVSPTQPVKDLLSPSKKPASRLSRPAPSKLAPPSPSVLGEKSSSTLMERLAAAQQSRTTSSGVSSSLGRAAELRARLEAVKQKSKVP